MSHTLSTTVRFSDRIALFLERTEYRLALTDEDREAVFRLRYESYMREGGIAVNGERRFTDPLDDTPNASIVMMHVDGELASAIRLHVAGDPETPLSATHVFPAQLLPHLREGRVFVDPTRHVTNFAFSRRFPEIPFLTVRSAWMAGEHFRADYILATVRVEHMNFYRRVFGHTAWSGPTDYPMLVKPIVCMALPFPENKALVEAKYPFYRSSAQEREALFGAMPLAPSVMPTSEPLVRAAISA